MLIWQSLLKKKKKKKLQEETSRVHLCMRLFQVTDAKIFTVLNHQGEFFFFNPLLDEDGCQSKAGLKKVTCFKEIKNVKWWHHLS